VKPSIEILIDPDNLARAAAHRIVAHSKDAVSQRSHFTIALSGGSTPKRLYELLANADQEYFSQIPWDQVQFFWTDERHVGPDHPDSNYRMVNEAMLSKVPLESAQVHRMLGELTDPDEAALRYESELSKTFDSEPPRFDLVLLGLGNDGHTASLFPGTTALQEQNRLVTAPWVEKLNSHRLTMTLPLLNNAAAIVFLVSGADKSDILSQVLDGPSGKLPAQSIRPVNGNLIWLVDRAAAAHLTLL
jgi:6-phosphogluconolactonase